MTRGESIRGRIDVCFQRVLVLCEYGVCVCVCAGACQAAAPLWMGVDLTKVAPAALEILLNKEVIAIDQDPLGLMATCRSPGGCGSGGSGGSGGDGGKGSHTNVVACEGATTWTYTRNDSVVGSGGAVRGASGLYLTAQGCAPEKSGDFMIMWTGVKVREAITGTAHHDSLQPGAARACTRT